MNVTLKSERRLSGAAIPGADFQPLKQRSTKLRSRLFRLTANKVLFLVVFLIPLAVFSTYEIFYASNRYESVASIIITQEQTSSGSVDLSFLGMTNTGSNRDAYVLTEFMQSLDMLKYLDARLHLRQHFSSDKVDYFSRLSPDASLEDFHDYFLKYATVTYDDTQQIIRYSVQTFDKKLSEQVVQAIIERSQEFIDRMNDKVTHEQMAFFDNEIAKSEKRLTEEKNRLVEFQNKNNMLSTDSTSATILATIGTLEQQLAQRQSDLNARLSVLDANAPQLTTMQLEITALKNQIKREKERLASNSSGALSDLGAKLAEIKMSLEFLTNLYKANLTALEQARIEAARRLKYLVVVASPTVADASLYPDRPYMIVTAAIILIVAYFVLSLMVALIREQA